MKPAILVSVVMPVYNGEKYLSLAIKSILEQQYEFFEFIIIDDGSTDNSSRIIKKYANEDNRIVFIQRENRGLVYSLNEGIALAKGDLIARMDADDISLPNRFQLQVDAFQNRKADLVGGHYFIIDNSDKIFDTCLVPVYTDAIVACLSLCPPFAHGSVMFRKQFYIDNALKYGGRYKLAEDYALWQDFFRAGAKIVNIDDFIFKYRKHEESFSVSKQKIMDKEVKLLRKNFVKAQFIALDQAVHSLKSLIQKSVFEESLLLEASFLLLKFKKRPSFIKVLVKSNKKNSALTLLKIFTGKL